VNTLRPTVGSRFYFTRRRVGRVLVMHPASLTTCYYYKLDAEFVGQRIREIDQYLMKL